MMTNSAAAPLKWKEIFERQQLANAERWLEILASTESPSDLVIEEHDNLLRALEVALQKEETFELAYRLINQLFPIVFGYGDWDRWDTYLNEAIELSQRLRLEHEEANLVNCLGDIRTLKGDYQEAQALFTLSMNQYKQLNDSANYARVLTRLAAINDLKGNVKESLILLEEALNVSESLGDTKILTEVNLSLSSAYHKSRQWLPGLSAAQKAYDLAEKSGDGHDEIRALLNIVAIHIELGNWQKIENLSPKIEKALVSSGDLMKLSQLKNNLGIAAFAQEDYFVAEKAWQDALKINLQINQPLELARNYNNLGMAYTKLGELDEAEKMFLQAIAYFEEMEDHYNWANTLDNMADIFEIKQDQAKYRETLIYALDLLNADTTESHVQNLIKIINGRLASTS